MEARRAALRAALRRGDVALAAWEASRLRLFDVRLDAAEAAGAAEARAALGRAIREARARRAAAAARAATVTTSPVGPAAKARPRLRWPVALFLAGAAALVVVLVLVVPRETEPAPGIAAVAVAPTDLRLASRGRTAPRQPPLPPATLASPEPTPSAAPAPSVAVRAGSGGSGTGTARPRPTVTPLPSPVATFPPRTPLPALSSSVTRFRGRVLDVSGQPLADACVVNGVESCTHREPYTDAAGYWVLDVPNNATWDLHFVLAGYSVGYRRVDSTGGEVGVPDIRLRSTR